MNHIAALRALANFGLAEWAVADSQPFEAKSFLNKSLDDVSKLTSKSSADMDLIEDIATTFEQLQDSVAAAKARKLLYLGE
jgi:propanediol dehydratase small subunit